MIKKKHLLFDQNGFKKRNPNALAYVIKYIIKLQIHNLSKVNL